MLKANIFGAHAKLHHIGLVVRSIKREAKLLGKTEIKSYLDKIQKVKVAFVDLSGAPLELIEPIDEKSPVWANLAKKQALVHLCFSVPDLDEATKKAKEYGFHVLSKPVGAIAFKNRPIVWLYQQSLGLVELVRGEK